MKNHPLFRPGLLCVPAVLLLTQLAPAEHVVVKGTTVTQTVLMNFLNSTNTSVRTTESTKLQQYGVYSSLGGTGYAYYTLNASAKEAYKSTGNFASGPMIYPNFGGSGRTFESHKQFNAEWNEDIPLLGDSNDIWNLKAGTLDGPRSMINLAQAGFSITAAPKLSGFHTHMRCSEEYGIDPTVGAGYSLGNFFQIDSSRSNFRFDAKLSDQANAAGGSLANGMAAVEQYLSSKNYVIIPVAPLPF
jgi:hypothetical protein